MRLKSVETRRPRAWGAKPEVELHPEGRGQLPKGFQEGSNTIRFGSFRFLFFLFCFFDFGVLF